MESSSKFVHLEELSILQNRNDSLGNTGVKSHGFDHRFYHDRKKKRQLPGGATVTQWHPRFEGCIKMGNSLQKANFPVLQKVSVANRYTNYFEINS